MINTKTLTKIIGAVLSALTLLSLSIVALGWEAGKQGQQGTGLPQRYRLAGSNQGETGVFGQSASSGSEVVAMSADGASTPGQMPPLDITYLASPNMEFNIAYNPAGGNCTNPQPWPQDAKDAFEYVLNVWGSLLNITHTIVVAACYQPDADPNTLASAGPVTSPANFTNAPVANAAYAIGLANQLANSDLNGSGYEIDANANTNISWYFKMDSNVPVNQFDFVSTMLHEIAHGLGFLDSMAIDDGTGDNECNGTLNVGCYQEPPTIYEFFVVNGNGELLIDTNVFNNNSIPLGQQITSNNIRFNGANAIRLNGAISPSLYAPSPYEQGSSIGHLDDNTYPNALMASATNPGLSSRFPSPRTLGILQDIGWDVNLLSLLKTASSSQVSGGQTLTYTLRVINSDSIIKTNIIITDTVPAGTTLLTDSLSGDAAYSGVTPGSIITWNTGVNLSQGQMLTRTFAVTIDTGVAGGSIITNTAYVSAELRANSNVLAISVNGSANNNVYLPIVIK